MKFTKVLVLAALFAAISVDAIRVTAVHDDEEENPDPDDKKPKVITPKSFPLSWKKLKLTKWLNKPKLKMP